MFKKRNKDKFYYCNNGIVIFYLKRISGYFDNELPFLGGLLDR